MCIPPPIIPAVLLSISVCAPVNSQSVSIRIAPPERSAVLWWKWQPSTTSLGRRFTSSVLPIAFQNTPAQQFLAVQYPISTFFMVKFPTHGPRKRIMPPHPAPASVSFEGSLEAAPSPSVASHLLIKTSVIVMAHEVGVLLTFAVQDLSFSVKSTGPAYDLQF